MSVKNPISFQDGLNSVDGLDDLRQAFPSLFYVPGLPGKMPNFFGKVNPKNALFRVGLYFANDFNMLRTSALKKTLDRIASYFRNENHILNDYNMLAEKTIHRA